MAPHDYFPWEKKYHVNVAVLDDQHQNILELVNDLHSRMTDITQQDSVDGVKATIETALDCLRVHFGLEEKLMRMTQYPALAERRRLHKEILHSLKETCDESDLHDPLIALRIIRMIAHELLRHIMLFDKSLGVFLNRNGVA